MAAFTLDVKRRRRWARMGPARPYNARSMTHRKRGRVVDCTGLENRQRATVREFESHRFRQQLGISPDWVPMKTITFYLDFI